MSDEFERLKPEFLAVARRIFDAGGKAERERLMVLLQSSNGSSSEPNRSPRKPRAQSTTYGSVSAPVRDALIQLAADSPEGVGARDIAQHFERRGSGPNERQVRAAIKTLSITGEAIRASRGRYLPRATESPRRKEEPGDEAPGSFDLAAE